MNKKSRTYNSIFNSLIGIVSAICNVALNFFVRVVIVRALGEEINGLHSLFQNIINIMAVVETSMCTAMIIHLYEPIKKNDDKELSDILSFYNKIYCILAIGFFIAGGILNVFLDQIITTDIQMRNAHFYFFIFTLSVVLSYLTYTYRVVLFAEQKNRISAIATLIAEVIFRGGAALMAIIFRSYTAFLICYIGEKICGNLLCRHYVKRKHQGLNCLVKNADNTELRKKILKTVKPLIITRLADMVQNSSQSILISILLGNIAVVGYYGNYVLVTGGIGILFSQLGASFTSSFGNLATEQNKDKMYNAYKKADFILSSIAIVICSVFVSCIQEFIEYVFGPKFLLGTLSVYIITFTMFITLINISTISVQNATGRHDLDVRNMIFQAIAAIIGGYLGGRLFGMEGLLIGMLIPMIFFSILYKNIIIQKVLFEKNTYEILKEITLLIIKGCVVFSCVLYATKQVNSRIILFSILIKGVLAILLSSAIIYIFSVRNPHLKSLLSYVLQIKNYDKINSRGDSYENKEN